MSQKIPEIEIAIWQAPMAQPPAQRQRVTPRLRRAVVTGAVLAVHVCAVIVLAVRPAPRTAGEPSASGMIAALLSPDSPFATGEISEPQLDLSAPALIEMEPPEVFIDETTEARETGAAAAVAAFMPPRLDTGHTPDFAEFVARAAQQHPGAARVILTVMVDEQGLPARVNVSLSSGHSGVDEVAIEYARALRWHPAVAQGHPTSVSIRLPVLFSVVS
jgi:TonB family protein